MDWKQIYAAYDSCSDGIGNGPLSVAACPAGYTLTGGGYGITFYNQMDDFRTNAPDSSAPIAGGQAWGVRAGLKSAYSCFKSFAICVK